MYNKGEIIGESSSTTARVDPSGSGSGGGNNYSNSSGSGSGSDRRSSEENEVTTTTTTNVRNNALSSSQRSSKSHSESLRSNNNYSSSVGDAAVGGVKDTTVSNSNSNSEETSSGPVVQIKDGLRETRTRTEEEQEDEEQGPLDNQDIQNEESSSSHAETETYHTPGTSLHTLLLPEPNQEESQTSENDHNPENNNMPPLDLVVEGQILGQITDEVSSTKPKDVMHAHLHEGTKEVESSPSPGEKLSLSLSDNDHAHSQPHTVDIHDLLSVSSESAVSNQSSTGTGVPLPLKQLSSKSGRKPAKKKMWYQQIFSASYKSRSGDFKKLFKELPVKERLLVDYSCAIQKEILVQGRMYVSQTYLSFHANIFGWETQTSIRFKDISSMTKEKTALVIPNAIQVVTEGGDKLFFTSFVTRDATFLMLFKLWQTALLEDTMPSKEMRRLIFSSYGEEPVVTSDDDTNINDETGSNLSVPAISPVSDSGKGDDESGDMPCTFGKRSHKAAPIITVTRSLGQGSGSPAPGDVRLPVGARHAGGEPSDISDLTETDEEFHVPADWVGEPSTPEELPICPVPHDDGREVINAIIPCNIDQLFTMLFTNSKFYLDLHTERKTFNIRPTEWEFGKDAKQTRQVSMTVSVNAVMGPKHAQVTETQVMNVSKPGVFYAIDCESVNSGIPYAEAFYVTIHYCLSRMKASETKLIVMVQIKYRKSVWGITKSIIEKNAWAGIEEFYTHLERALKEECDKMRSNSSPCSTPKHSMNSAVKRRPLRNKRRAPDIPIGVPPASRNPSSMRPSILSSATDHTVSASELKEAGSREEGSMALKIILSILTLLVSLNMFLYFKLTNLETSTPPAFLAAPTISFPGDLPQSHQDWLLLLQKQEVLHRIELQKWHEILISALNILHKAESDLETLKIHISSYSSGGSFIQTNPTTTTSAQNEDPQQEKLTPTSISASGHETVTDSQYKSNSRINIFDDNEKSVDF